MHKLLLLLLLIKNVIADEEEINEKYIDLLPEEEKQEFLNRIARRILEGIKSSDTPNESHADITDDQLDAQDTYVQEILKEESKNFKSEKRLLSSETKEGFENDRLYTNSGNKDEHIDLTLREGKRQKRKTTNHNVELQRTTELSYDEIPVQTIYEQYENNNNNLKNDSGVLLNSSKNNTSLVKEYEENIGEEMKETPTSELKESDPKATIIPNNDSITNIENNESLRKTYDKFKLGTTLITDFEPNSNENSPATEDYNVNNDDITPTPISNEINNNTTSDEGTWGSTQKIYVEDISEDKGESRVEETTKAFQNTTNIEIQQTDSTTNSIDVTKTNNSEIIIDSTTENVTISSSPKYMNFKFKEKNLRSETDNDELLFKEMQTEVSYPETGLYMQTIPTEKSGSPSSVRVTTATNYDELLNEENVGVTEHASIKNVNISPSKLPEHTNVDSSTKRDIGLNSDDTQTNLVYKTNILRTAQGNLDESEMDVKESLQNIDANSKKLEAYEVYEVDSNKSHYKATGKTKVKDHPYYIPVYNYASDNAYFKPYNKLGPNIEDVQDNSPESEIIIEDPNNNFRIDLPHARSRFSGYSNKEKGHYNIRNTKNSNKKLFEFTKPFMHKLTYQNVYYSPYDYPDMDYYFGRVLRRGKNHDYEDENDNDILFPDSNEPDHPISSIHNSNTIKDHVRAIRKLLYLQKLFGYVPKETDMIVRKANQYFQISKKPKIDHIAMDYYYNRADSKEQDTNSRLFQISKSFINHLHPNIAPLTPNPLSESIEENKPTKRQQITLNNHVRNKLQNQREKGISFSELFQSMLIVLEDMIKLNNENLIKYDWLKTTVNIQAAIRKLIDLIEKLQYGEYIHPKDVELIKYTLYLFKSSNVHMEKGSKNQNLDGIIDTDSKRVKNKNTLPKTKRIIKEPLKMWKKFAAYILREDKIKLKEQRYKLLYAFEDFLQSLLFYLNDLHDAIKHISIITKYNNQAWFRDLKDVFLNNADRKHLAQVLLHVSLSKLLDLIEESAASGVEEGFRSFVNNNKELVKRSREEFRFVLNVLAELRRMKASE